MPTEVAESQTLRDPTGAGRVETAGWGVGVWGGGWGCCPEAAELQFCAMEKFQGQLCDNVTALSTTEPHT